LSTAIGVDAEHVDPLADPLLGGDSGAISGAAAREGAGGWHGQGVASGWRVAL